MAAGVPPAPVGLLEVFDRILDKGIVTDAFARVSMVGIELLTIEARVVVSSVETYLKYAERIHEIGLVDAPRNKQTHVTPSLASPTFFSLETGRKEGEEKEKKIVIEKWTADIEEMEATASQIAKASQLKKTFKRNTQRLQKV
ncbi:MAG: gas vesicle protein GvpJ [Candidatus Geothermarchaeales archaeon]